MARWQNSEAVRRRIMALLSRQSSPVSAKTVGQILGLDRGSLYPVLSRMEEDGDIVTGLRDGYRVFVMGAGIRLEAALALLGDDLDVRRLSDQIRDLTQGLDRLTRAIERLH